MAEKNVIAWKVPRAASNRWRVRDLKRQVHMWQGSTWVYGCFLFLCSCDIPLRKIINSKTYDSQIFNFQRRKLTILNSKISIRPQSKKFKFTNLKILNPETSQLLFVLLLMSATLQFLYIIFDTSDNLRVSLINNRKNKK